jgi:hypothetical protein
MSEVGNHVVRPIYIARDIVVNDGALVNTVESPDDRSLSDLAMMIAILHPGEFTLPAESHWFLVCAGSDFRAPLGYVELVRETGTKWAYGHIYITDRDAARTVFQYVKDAVGKMGGSIDDDHPDHGWYEPQEDLQS